jgi:DNA-directed RNA polymerase subunit RPC12/RpoP
VTKEVLYKCANCGRLVSKDELEKLKLGVRCPYCYSKILYKIRTSGRVYFKAV